MKLILGLGNPGKEYAATRHNAGFLTVNALCERWGSVLKKERTAFSLCAHSSLGRQKVVLAEPLTYMNLSGVALRALRAHHRLRIPDILVVCDDLDLEFGRLRFRERGSSAGHRGLQSVNDALGTDEFCRLRIGIGRPPRGVDPAEYVLSDFFPAEREELDDIITGAGDCCESWIRRGVVECMNVHNRKLKVQSKK